METLAENIWLLSYPLKFLGFDLRRNVTVVRLPSGKLAIHSSAPFDAEDVKAIRSLGSPQWILDPMLDHDTFAANGRTVFPEAEYLAPMGFAEKVGFPVTPLVPEPAEWDGVLECRLLEGAPSFSEHVVFHRPSGTLIVADLLVNFEPTGSFLKDALLKMGLGGHTDPGFSKRFKFAIKDRPLFRESLAAVLDMDFQRIVVGHGHVIAENAKKRAVETFAREGLL